MAPYDLLPIARSVPHLRNEVVEMREKPGGIRKNGNGQTTEIPDYKR